MFTTYQAVGLHTLQGLSHLILPISLYDNQFMNERHEAQRGLVTLTKATELRKNKAWGRTLFPATPRDKATLPSIPPSYGACDPVGAIKLASPSPNFSSGIFCSFPSVAGSLLEVEKQNV